MKRLLIPISFSDASTHSLRYAKHLNEQFGIKLSLLHSFPAQEYNREFNFGKKNYDLGIKEELLKLFVEHLDSFKQEPKLLVQAGFASDFISSVSKDYDLMVMSSKSTPSSSKSWISDRFSTIISKANCPVLILPSSNDAFNFADCKNIWHINRKDIEANILSQKLPPFKLNPTLVQSKSLIQTTFKSSLWQKIVSFTKPNKNTSLQDIINSEKAEHIDLIILVKHNTSAFQAFFGDDVVKMFVQLNIPILILPAR